MMTGSNCCTLCSLDRKYRTASLPVRCKTELCTSSEYLCSAFVSSYRKVTGIVRRRVVEDQATPNRINCTDGVRDGVLMLLVTFCGRVYEELEGETVRLFIFIQSIRDVEF